MQRRDFVRLLGGAAAAWPLALRAQQPERVRRIGVLMGGVATDTDQQARLKAVIAGLQELGWVEGRNLRIEIRWAEGESERASTNAPACEAPAGAGLPKKILSKRGRFDFSLSARDPR